MTRILALIGMAAFCFAISSARAEIGSVGSSPAPKALVVPAENAPSKTTPGQGDIPVAVQTGEPSSQLQAGEKTMAAEAKPKEPEPLLEVNFTRPTVYFDRALAKGVEAAEAAKPGVVYEVTSYMPAAGATRQQNERMNQQAVDEVQSVVSGLRAQGVQESRIRVVTHIYKAGEKPPENHKVSVFVK